ncbi:hypothetical protein BDP27DRAFT_1424814 [Rhodocollybia butyracea]|uniref:Uncharacterized protein n=1 Tax=Rhodocollybia butyracea TaxID=206335 RepID=A0A9P5U420_9AGAR|nr:hypothetical protein BDP27DRAFT_1424814 [Rhodocollybia butyracea]
MVGYSITDSHSEDEESDEGYPTDDEREMVPLIPRSEPSRLDTLLDRIQNHPPTQPHLTPDLDDTQAREWLEENYDGLVEVPGYEIFSLRCKPGREKTIAKEIQSDIHLQYISFDIIKAAFPSQKRGTLYIQVRNMNHSNIPLSSYLKRFSGLYYRREPKFSFAKDSVIPLPSERYDQEVMPVHNLVNTPFRLDATSHYRDVTFTGRGNLSLDDLPFHHPSRWALKPNTWVVPKSGLYRGDPGVVVADVNENINSKEDCWVLFLPRTPRPEFEQPTQRARSEAEVSEEITLGSKRNRSESDVSSDMAPVSKRSRSSRPTPIHRRKRSSCPHLWESGIGTTSEIHERFPGNARTTCIAGTECDDPLSCEHKKQTFLFDQEIYRGLAVVPQKINNLSRATQISHKFLQGFKACCPESEHPFLQTVPPPGSWSFTPEENVEVSSRYRGIGSTTGTIDEVHPLYCEVVFSDGENTFLEAVPHIHLRKKFSSGDLVRIVQSVPPIKGVQQSQIPNSIVCTVELKVVPIAGLEGFVSSSNEKYVEVWVPELELMLNIDHNCLQYQPNLSALGEIRRENPFLLAEHPAAFSAERPMKHLDLTKHSPNLDPNTQLPINPHTGVSPWKDLRVSIGGTESDKRGGYKPAELIKGLRCTVLDVKADHSTHSGLAVLVRPDGRSAVSWVDYSRVRREDNHRFLHEEQRSWESSRPLYYSFKRGYLPTYSDQERATLSGRLNPGYEAAMTQTYEKQVQKDREEEEKRKQRLEDEERKWIEYEETGGRDKSPVVTGAGDAELELPEHWILNPRLKECLGERSIYVATSLSRRKDYAVSLRPGSDGQVEVWTDEKKSRQLNLEDVDREAKSRTLLDHRYEQNLLVVVEGEHAGNFVRVLSVDWTRSLRCQRVQITGVKDKAGKEYQEEILPDVPFLLEKDAVAVVKQTEHARKVGNELMQTLRHLERDREGSLDLVCR